MPEDMPDRMPEDMPDRMPDRMPEDMSGRMPEDLPISKCINVMVGITRSKVFFCKCPSVFCTFPAFPEFLPGNCKFAKKKNAKKKCQKSANKLRFHDSAEHCCKSNASK
jgi:hypothetical protein